MAPRDGSTPALPHAPSNRRTRRRVVRPRGRDPDVRAAAADPDLVVRARSHRARTITLSSPRGGERDPPRRARRTVTPSPPRRRVRNQDADANHPAGEPRVEPARVHLVLVSLLLVIHAATTTPFLRPRPAAAPRVSPRTRPEIQTPAPTATPASDAVLALPGGLPARATDTTQGYHGDTTRRVALEADMRARTVALEAEVLDLRARLDDAAAAAETAAEAEATRRTADEEEAEARARAWYDAYREVRETCGRSESGARWGGGWMGAATVSSGASAWT